MLKTTLALLLAMLAGVANAQGTTADQYPVHHRTRYATHYQLPNGQIRAVITIKAQNYLAADGTWQPIIETLTASADQGFECLENGLVTHFPAKLNDGVFCRGQTQPGVRMSPAALVGLGESGNTLVSADARVAFAKLVDGQTVQYAGVFAGVTDEYSVRPDTVKHTMLLSRTALDGFENTASFGGEYVIDLPAGMSAGLAKDGRTIELRDSKGKAVYQIGQVFATDAAGEATTGQLRTRISGNKLYATMLLDTAWMLDAKRVWPIRLDPQLVLQPDATAGIDSQTPLSSPTSNWGTYTDLTTNWSGNTDEQSWVQFDVTSITSGSQVTAAQFEMYHYTNTIANNIVEVRQVTSAWSESTITYNTRPTFAASAATTLNYGAGSPGIFRVFTGLASLAQGWVNSSATNFGIRILNQTQLNMIAYHYSSDWGTATQRPRLTVDYTNGAGLNVAVTAGSVQQVYSNYTGTGGNGFDVGSFSITNTSATLTGTLTGIQVQGAGTGNHTSAYTSFEIYRETGTTSGYDFATDTLIGSGTFAGSPAQTTVSVSGAEQTFNPSAVKNYYLVAKLNGSATPGQTFTFTINNLTYGAGTSATGVPSSSMAGFSILAPVFAFADASPATQGTAYLSSVNNLIQQFTITYANGPNNTLTSITVQASGSGNDQTDYAAVKLYRDNNANSTFEAAQDTLVDTKTAFPTNDGSMSFALSGAESNFTAGTTRTYFIIVDFNTNGTNNTNFATQLQSASGQSTGTTITGMPSPTGGPTPGLNLLANNLNATLNGPGTAASIDNNEQGAGGNGVVLCDVSLNTISAAWTVNTLTFHATGSGNDLTAYGYLALHEDINANGTFDGPGTDTLAVAAAGSAFVVDEGDYVATLTNGAFPATTTRRFFLVAKWNGTAVAGNTFSARLQSIAGTPPSGGLVTGTPTAYAATFTINAAVLSVANAPTAPASQMIQGGAAFSHNLGLFRFVATNNTVTINAITLTTSGTGNWATDLAAAGVELYVDNGNGTFDVGLDTLVFSGAGVAGSMPCTLTSAVVVSNGGTKDIWVRLNLVATAGASIPETFIASIANTTDVNATGGTVAFGSPAPTTNTLSVIIFFVTTFAPAFDVQTGGAAITITGSGFLSPVTVTIGGAVCGGTAVIGASGTQITGLTVPPGTGTGKTIILTDGALGPKTLTQKFDYAGGSLIGGSGKGKGGGGGGCEANDSNAAWLAALALLAFAGALALRKRMA